jgi:HSP20 family protein
MRWPVKRPFGGPARWDPFEEIRRTQERLNQLFEDYIPIEEWAGKIYTPAVDILDEDNKLVVTTDLPGVNKEDIELNVKDDMLEISAKCSREKETEEEGYLRRERAYTRFYRAVKLPSNVTEEGATAKMENGVLKITLPKLKIEEPKARIQIE